MKINDTISVNPSKTTLGHVEAPASSIFRSHVIEREQSQGADAFKLAFPTTKATFVDFQKYFVPLRTLFATILIVSGITFLSASTFPFSPALGVCSLCFGGLLALGLLTRPVMLGASIFYCISGALSLRMGAADISIFSLMFGSIIFGIMGAGKYSCDELIRHAVRCNQRNSEKKGRENRLSYKAFHSMLK